MSALPLGRQRDHVIRDVAPPSRRATCAHAMSKLLEADDVAKTLGMSRDWVYAEVRAGRIPHVRLGRYVRFREEAIDDWIRECERGKISRTS